MRVTVDIVLFTIQDAELQILLIRRGIPPFEGRYALPGGFLLDNESLDRAALRELREETGVSNVFLEQLYTFGSPGRDPRDRVVTVAYYALISASHSPLKAGTDAAEAKWFPAAKLPPLAFDHRKIAQYALQRLRNKLEYTTVGFQLLPEKFTLTGLQGVYEAILEKKMDKRNFRRKIAQLNIVEPLNEWQHTGRKPAQLYRFIEKQAESPDTEG